ncbi:MAG: hypothetical protein FJ313_05435 [Gemmatimonadetes bacterium]|nr:hypothetical protein [Gemmatimonadota bacterium]
MRLSPVAVLTAIAFAAVVSTACAGAAPSSSGRSGNAERKTGPVLAFDKESVELLGVPRNLEAVATFLVINKGNAPLRLGRPRLGVGAGGVPGGEVLDAFEVAPGQAELLYVNLGAHGEGGAHRVAVTVPSNDPVRPFATLSASYRVAEAEPAAGPGPRLSVDKETIWSGTVPPDRPLYEQFVLRNDGDDALVFEGVPAVRVEEGC